MDAELLRLLADYGLTERDVRLLEGGKTQNRNAKAWQLNLLRARLQCVPAEDRPGGAEVLLEILRRKA